MAGTSFRPAEGGGARAGDLLPTLAAVAKAKDAAIYWMAVELRQGPWPLGEAAHAKLDLVGLVAFEALWVACPDVSPGHLARSLGLPLGEVSVRLGAAKAAPSWPSVAVSRVVAELRGEASR